MSSRTLLIGLDGADFSVLRPLMDQGVMPFLKSFILGGISADLRTIIPPLTPPAWTSLVTGCRPGRHGVFDFFQVEPTGKRHIRFFSSHDVQCETIWSLASRSGKRITSLNFPAMFPAPHLDGSIVPGWVPWKGLRLACSPQNLYEQLRKVPDLNVRELAMDTKLEEKATEGCVDSADYLPWIELHTRREQNWLRTFEHLHSESPAELTGVLLDGVDKLQHLCWRFLRPEDDQPLKEDWEFRVREACLEYFRSLDGVLEKMCSLAGPETTVFIASDHGFGPTRDILHLNEWLAQKGYLVWSDSAREDEDPKALLGVGRVARHTWMMDWTKTKAFAPTPTSNGIHIIVKENGSEAGIDPSEYEAFRNRLTEELLDVRDDNGEAVVTTVYTREEAFEGPHSGSGPDLTLMLRDGGLVSILPADQTLSQRPAVGGAHRPVGVFAARGPGIRKRRHMGEISILDVAPTILYSLDLPVLESIEGQVRTGIYLSKFTSKRPVRLTADLTPQDTPSPSTSESTFTEEDEENIVKSMRDLGYME